MLSDIYNTFRVQCDFILGSDAQGCMVVLVGELVNTTVNISKSLSLEIVNAAYSVSCYKKVLAFDIEGDGQIGALAVPGKLSGNFNVNTKCSPSSRTSGHGMFWTV